MTKDSFDHETFRWLLLIGHMLANIDMRAEALKAVQPDDVPEPLKRLWRGMAAGDGAEVWGVLLANGVEKRGDKVAGAVLAAVMEGVVSKFCEQEATRIGYAKGVRPAEMRDMLQSSLGKIHAKITAIELQTGKPAV